MKPFRRPCAVFVFFVSIVFTVCCAGAVAGEGIETPAELWADYDPNAGDFTEEIIREETKDGIYSRESSISCHVLDSEIRVYCLYAVKAGAVKAPGLLNVHGWMGAASIPQDYVNDGWAVMSFDYCGKTGDRKHFTKNP